VCLALQTDRVEDDSWHSELADIFSVLGLKARESSIDFVSRLTKAARKKRIEELMEKVDSTQLFGSFSHTSCGLHYAQIKRHPGQEQYIWKYDRRSACIKFALRSRSYRLQARIHEKGRTQGSKVCKLCYSGDDETEEHHLLQCTAFLPERLLFCDTLSRHLIGDFPREYTEFLNAPASLQTAFLLGRFEDHWSHQVPILIDMFKCVHIYWL
jgi:hypothetical protein